MPQPGVVHHTPEPSESDLTLADVLVPVAVRFGVKLTTMKHIGSGLPQLGQKRRR